MAHKVGSRSETEPTDGSRPLQIPARSKAAPSLRKEQAQGAPAPPTAFPCATALWKAWERTAARLAEEPAFLPLESDRWISFREIDSAARALAHEHLSDARNAWIAFSLPNGPEWIGAFLACQAAGAAAMPLDATIPEGELAPTAQRLGASFLWTPHRWERLAPRRIGRAGIAVVKLSSGSRREAVPLPFSAEAMIEDGWNTSCAMGTGENDRALALLPLGHSYALGSLVLPFLLRGMRLVSAATFLASQIPRWIRSHRITFFPSVPDVWRALGQLPRPLPLPSLRIAVSAGAALPAETAQRIQERFSVKIHSLYGSSETGSISYDGSGEATLAGRSVGTPLPRVSVTITRTRRVSVSSRALFGRRRRITLPDLAEWTDRGEIRLLGRADPVITIGGRKIHPAEVEALLRRLPSVTDAHVRGVRGRTRSYLIAAAESPKSASELLRLLADVAPEWKIPRFLVCLPALPRNARGKVEEKSLRALFHDIYRPFPSTRASQMRPSASGSSDS
ncbi:Acyl-CoA synthetase (AMP-forming)/AMP-acid ligase II [Methylacidimicrobium sp. AP8]|uniref:class I adenylate-forming enzyme family protein n=1 Tax=Methylacidimicrobium sp. AP8 TaxID=2730359 RepID=UPI0018C1045E|nr:fatty acid--CoA ligase family protein [Methylacidimicrobium sp. AP8]CAB4243460.1 Acyl-CoA synthetase (AMP-forming)/AMP-acid ligase II [Methylacidimicrobium sp. AP8]